jgi:two-component system response regulator AtoC/two-component system nitrogen regulation response regulator NtrX
MDSVAIAPENFPMFKDLEASHSNKSMMKPTLGAIDFNAVVHEDLDFELTAAEFERTFLSNALDRHPSISECCKAINLPRSTLDARRRRYGLV